MAFTYDNSTNRGKVRLKLSDTSSAAYIFEDDEIDLFLTDGGTVNKAVLEGLKVLYASRALRAKRASIQGLSIDDTAQLAELKTLITMYGGSLIGLVTPTITGPSVHEFDEAYERPTT